MADYTFIINKRVAPAQGATLTTQYHDPERNAIVMCHGGQYAKTFEIWINGGLVARYTTPRGDAAEHADYITIQNIVAGLKTSFDDSTLPTAGWVCHNMQDYLWIQAPASDSIREIKTVDGYNNKLLSGFKRDVQKTEDLPVQAPANYQIRINGDAATGQDDYWVRFDA
ncbi:MAG: hypothetical protein ACRDC4_07925, partial [Plesiomonas sp.]